MKNPKANPPLSFTQLSQLAIDLDEDLLDAHITIDFTPEGKINWAIGSGPWADDPWVRGETLEKALRCLRSENKKWRQIEKDSGDLAPECYIGARKTIQNALKLCADLKKMKSQAAFLTADR